MKKLLAACILALFSALAAAGGDGVLRIDNAWIPEAPPGAKVYAAFMTMHNPGKQDVALVGASSPDFRSIEIHRTIMENGMARMQRQDKIDIAAGSDLVLQHGSYHMMLFHPNRPLAAGDKVAITLKFSNQKTQEIVAPVRVQSEDSEGTHEHHMHMQM